MSEAELYLNLDEWQRIQCLLGKLLTCANPKEQELVLHIHSRIQAVYASQASDRATIDFLKTLAS
jgi:hypothetical protein